jgi:hypothetical protein
MDAQSGGARPHARSVACEIYASFSARWNNSRMLPLVRAGQNRLQRPASCASGQLRSLQVPGDDGRMMQGPKT